jgi:hypothetical protein
MYERFTVTHFTIQVTARNLSTTVPVDLVLFPIENLTAIVGTPDQLRERPFAKAIALMPTGGMSVKTLNFTIPLEKQWQMHDSSNPLSVLTSLRHSTTAGAGTTPGIQLTLIDPSGATSSFSFNFTITVVMHIVFQDPYLDIGPSSRAKAK